MDNNENNIETLTKLLKKATNPLDSVKLNHDKICDALSSQLGIMYGNTINYQSFIKELRDTTSAKVGANLFMLQLYNVEMSKRKNPLIVEILNFPMGGLWHLEPKFLLALVSADHYTIITACALSLIEVDKVSKT